MDNSERKKWLDSLKIGDEVAVDTGSYGFRDHEIRKVERITPTRRFSVEGRSWEFDSNGQERGKTSTWTPRKQMEPVTQKIIDSIRKKHVVARIEPVKWKDMDLARLEKILVILDSDE